MPEKEFYQKYTKLRTLLDAIAMGSVRYCMQPKRTRRRTERLDELIASLKEVEENIREKNKSSRVEAAAPASGVARASAESLDADFVPDAADESACPDGYYRCGAACVPYPCPDGSE
jgi:hypothetical protein